VIKPQTLLVRSEEARQLAVRQVANNPGGNTPGVDGVVWDSSEAIRKVLSDLHAQCTGKAYQATPVKRVWIPKPGKTTLRPLGIPTLLDRSMQALWAMA